MLPKPEKNKKINRNLLEDAQITQESEEVLAQKRLKTKRRLILISLICTAGISLTFWTIRTVQGFIASPPSFKFDFKIELPKFSSSSKSSSKTNFSDAEIKKIIGDKNWSVGVVFKSNPSNLIFQNNSSADFSSVIDNLSKVKPSEESLIGLNLPQGLTFQEKIDSLNNINYQNIINLPSNQVVISITTDSNSLESVKPEIVSLTESLYWYAVSHLK